MRRAARQQVHDEEEEIRKAIEASMRTAAMEEERRIRESNKPVKSSQPAGGDFDFNAGGI